MGGDSTKLPAAAEVHVLCIRAGLGCDGHSISITAATQPSIRVVNVPGCPVQPDNFMETLLYLLYQAAGRAPMIPLDEQFRPAWLFGQTVHEGCDRAGYYE